MKHWKRFFLSSAIALSFMVTAGCDQSELRDSNALWGQADATEVDINTKVPGRLIKLYVKEGSEVKKGEKLAEIDQREQNALESAAQAKVEAAKAACLQAEANYDQALRDIQRYEMLYQNGAVSKAVYESYSNKRDVMSAVYEQSKASLAASEEAWKQSSINQGETTLVAPFDGIVTTKYSDNRRSAESRGQLGGFQSQGNRTGQVPASCACAYGGTQSTAKNRWRHRRHLKEAEFCHLSRHQRARK